MFLVKVNEGFVFPRLTEFESVNINIYTADINILIDIDIVSNCPTYVAKFIVQKKYIQVQHMLDKMKTGQSFLSIQLLDCRDKICSINGHNEMTITQIFFHLIC